MKVVQRFQTKKSIYRSRLADVMRPVLPSADWTGPSPTGGAAIITRYRPEHQRGRQKRSQPDASA